MPPPHCAVPPSALTIDRCCLSSVHRCQQYPKPPPHCPVPPPSALTIEKCCLSSVHRNLARVKHSFWGATPHSAHRRGHPVKLGLPGCTLAPSPKKARPRPQTARWTARREGKDDVRHVLTRGWLYPEVRSDLFLEPELSDQLLDPEGLQQA